MSEIPIVTIDVERFSTKKQQKLLAMLNDRGVKTECNKILADYINHFVPKDTGQLRRSARATSEFIAWGEGLQYARYQYGGEIYGKNFPIIRNGRIVGWYSKPGVPKHPTGRRMSAYKGNDWLGYHFGYSEPGTEHHWDVKFNKNRRWKAKANREITRYLKAECKRRGLKT